MQKFQDVLDGKTTTEGFTAEELVEFRKFASNAAKEEENRVAGLREAKRAEEKRIADAKAEADRIEAENKNKNLPPNQNPQDNPQLTQFRSEQVTKAKNKLLSQVKLTPEQVAVVEDKFKRLDTGKLDADLIYEDYLSALAAANPQQFMALSKEKSAAEEAAQEEERRQAEGGGGNPPPNNQPPKYAPEVVDLAKRAGIEPAAAEKIAKEGLTRTFE